MLVLPGMALAYFSFSNQDLGQVLGDSTLAKQPVIVVENGQQSFYYSQKTATADILADLKIVTYPEDRVKAMNLADVGLGTKIVIQRATPVEIIDGGQSKIVRTWQETVGKLLAEQKITVGADDILTPGQDELLKPNTQVKITRVKIETTTEQESIDFKVVQKNTDDLLQGTSQISQAGQNGEDEVTYQSRYEDGVLIKKEETGRKTISAAVDQIVLIGTGLPLVGTGSATWFDAPTGTCAHRTLPFGTRLRITNLANGKQAFCTVEDRGPYTGAIIDLSPDVFSQLSSLGTGVIWVKVEKAN